MGGGRVIGIDPGLRIAGYACAEPDESAPAGVRLIEAGSINLKPKHSVAQRLLELDDDLRSIIDRLTPATIAIEKLYAHYKHPATAIVMGHARGVILLAAQRAGATIVELGATEVKKSLTGSGHASKAQMQAAVKAQLNLAEIPRPPDVADAIAVAMCCLWRQRLDA